MTVLKRLKVETSVFTWGTNASRMYCVVPLPPMGVAQVPVRPVNGLDLSHLFDQ